jgi:hypothetical protein
LEGEAFGSLSLVVEPKQRLDIEVALVIMPASSCGSDLELARLKLLPVIDFESPSAIYFSFLGNKLLFTTEKGLLRVLEGEAGAELVSSSGSGFLDRRRKDGTLDFLTTTVDEPEPLSRSVSTTVTMVSESSERSLGKFRRLLVVDEEWAESMLACRFRRRLSVLSLFRVPRPESIEGDFRSMSSKSNVSSAGDSQVLTYVFWSLR